MTKPLVRIVDDDEAVLEGLRFILETEGWEVASYTNAMDFLREDTPSRSGCLILDVAMPEMTGLELQQRMRERNYNLPIIFLTGHGDIDMAVQAIKLGAVEFLQKTSDNERILQAVAKAVAQSRRGYATLSVDPFEARRRWQSLTERETQIMRLVASGLLNRLVAERLSLSVRTVETHRAAAFRKLGVHSSAELSSLIALAEE